MCKPICTSKRVIPSSVNPPSIMLNAPGIPLPKTTATRETRSNVRRSSTGDVPRTVFTNGSSTTGAGERSQCHDMTATWIDSRARSVEWRRVIRDLDDESIF